MRIKNLIIWDIKFQIKYGFYTLYAFMSIFYSFILLIIPQSIKIKAGIIMIFLDPAAMGIFFMGAIILLEKSERVLNVLAISPVMIIEYLISKIVSLGIISIFVAIILSYISGIKNIIPIINGTFLTSCLFTLLGIIIGVNINNLNQYIISTVPIQIICFIPPLFYIFGYNASFIKYYPFNSCIRLIMNENIIINDIIIVIITILALFIVAYHFTKKMFREVRGIKW